MNTFINLRDRQASLKWRYNFFRVIPDVPDNLGPTFSEGWPRTPSFKKILLLYHPSPIGKGGLNFFRGRVVRVRGHLDTPLKGWAPDCPGLPFSEYIYQLFIGNRHKEFCVDVAFSFGNLFSSDRLKSLEDQIKSVEDQIKSIRDENKSLQDRIKSASRTLGWNVKHTWIWYLYDLNSSSVEILLWWMKLKINRK